MSIHATAIVHRDAELASDVSVGPYSIIESGVQIGSGTEIGPHVVIKPYTTIGRGCRIYQFASIGEIPQDLKFKGEKSYLVIGDNNQIREYVTMNRGTEGGGGITRIGNNNLFMAYAHVAHDCSIGNHAILANAATLAGHIQVADYASIGGLVAIHQFVRVGEHAFIGGKSAVTLDIPPFMLASGDRATLHGVNTTGLSRRGFSDEIVQALKKAYRILFRSGLKLAEAMDKVREELGGIPEIERLLDFLNTSERGITR
ncbi:MAG: acyl-ACP--UDP-N-acetylglucosamine O-acyltransferase [Deltaproteobacteria bacterium]|nr:acyl-ACP--UDP-N-acetylglucosamine O-acyltransferase [Deltaproteobacteria bacterium]